MAAPEDTQTPAEQGTSSASQFKKQREAREKGEVITLVSGASVHVKRPDVQKLIAQGLIPAQMVQGFMSIQQKGQSAIKAEDLTTMLGLQREVAKYALVAPKIVDQPNYDNNEISVDDLSSEELDDIWAYVNGGMEMVEKFRKERESGNVLGPDSEEVSE